MLPRRLFLRLVLAAIFVPLADSGAGAGTAAAARPLFAVCGAYPPEMEALHAVFGVDEAAGWERSEWKGITLHRGTFAGKDLVVFSTGVSIVNATMRLQAALDHLPITHVLFAGVAGGIDPSLHVGDVVIPERWTYHSEAAYLNEDGKGGYFVPEYFKPRYENFGMIFPDDVAVRREGEATFVDVPAFPADPLLVARARAVLPSLPEMRKAGRAVSVLVGGTGVAGPVFLDNARYREWVFRVWQARCLDMESTALAHVAYANHKPILIVRGLSDLAGGQHGLNPIDDNEAPVSVIAARVLREVIAGL
ncbi:MAG: 5'-methylthioadenosine/S-adenosylhomocysteine nucleosidase [Opitutaceae bacterium]|nr:5'-methylthioadenosine/S-adenosylhomocysteine nucleosidase [Opitutaceae bacterium]